MAACSPAPHRPGTGDHTADSLDAERLRTMILAAHRRLAQVTIEAIQWTNFEAIALYIFRKNGNGINGGFTAETYTTN